MRMVFNLSKGLDRQQIYDYFSKVKYLPANCLVTFEDMFGTRFWDEKEVLHFTWHNPNPRARYEANFVDKTLRTSWSLPLEELPHAIAFKDDIMNRKGVLLIDVNDDEL